MSSSSPSELSIEKVTGKRVQKDVLVKEPPKPSKTSSGPGEPSIEKVEGKPVQGDRVPDITKSEPPKMNLVFKIHPSLGPIPNRVDPVSGHKLCGCGRLIKTGSTRGANERFKTIPGTMVDSFNWPLVDEMIAKSDDKTLVVSNITYDIKKETDFLKLFEPYGKVSSVKLAPLFVEPDSPLGDFGFVTFVNKEDAAQAMKELNASGPRGRDKRTLRLDWVSNLKKPT